MTDIKVSITLSQSILDFISKCSLSGESKKIEFLSLERDSQLYLFPNNTNSDSLIKENSRFSTTKILLHPIGDELSSLLEPDFQESRSDFLWLWDYKKLNKILDNSKNIDEKNQNLFFFLERNSRLQLGRKTLSFILTFSHSKNFLKTMAHTGQDSKDNSDSLHSRNLILFGEENFNRITNFKIGCIGAGGLMNPFVIQSMHHGFKNFVIVDSDRLEVHNSNRFLGYNSSQLGKYKVEILKNILQDYSNDIHAEVFPVFFPENTSMEALSCCDLLVAGVDNDQTRIQVQILALILEKPYLDMGSGVILKDNFTLHPEVEERGGQIKLYVPGGPCISCMGLNPATLRDISDSPINLLRGYVRGTELTPPSILSLNGTIAGMGIKLLTDYITDTGTTIRHIKYNEKDFKLFTVKAERIQTCRVCG